MDNSGTANLTDCTWAATPSAAQLLRQRQQDGGVSKRHGQPDQLHGTATLNDCTLSGNYPQRRRDARRQLSAIIPANLTLTDCTVSGNSAGDGGGVFNSRHGQPDRLHHQRQLRPYGGGVYNYRHGQPD